MTTDWSGRRSTRLKACAGLAILLHGLLALGGALSLGSRPEYGLAGAVAGGGGGPKAAPPTEAEVDLIQDVADAPSERRAPAKAPRRPPAPPAAAPGPASSGAQELPSYYRNPPPTYPAEARRLGQEGLVLLRVGVDAVGLVASASVLRSSGSPLLDASALQGVRAWRFKPASMAGIPVATEVNIPVQFRLKELKR